MKRLVVVLLPALLAGCNLYFGGDDDTCKRGYGADVPAQQLRDPWSGACDTIGGGGCGEDGCGPCAELLIDTTDWASCYGPCEALDENTCIATSACRAAYDGNPAADQLPKFLGCWEVAPSGPIEGGGCTGLDALSCSRHDDCSAYYETAVDGPPGSGPLGFVECFPEKAITSCDVIDCAPGYHCDGGQCIADPPACETLATEAACTARQDCSAVYDGHDCTCTPENGCHCQSQTFNHCESLAMP